MSVDRCLQCCTAALRPPAAAERQLEAAAVAAAASKRKSQAAAPPAPAAGTVARFVFFETCSSRLVLDLRKLFRLYSLSDWTTLLNF